MTKNQIKIGFVGLMVILFMMLALWLYTIIYQESDTNPINDFRVIIHPIYQEIRDSSLTDYSKTLEEVSSHKAYLEITFIDLSGKIIETSRSDSPLQNELFLDELLYTDHSYDQKDSYYKLSMPLYAASKVNGFVIFEMDKAYFNSLQEKKSQVIIDLIRRIVYISVPIVIVLIISLLWFVLYRYEDTSLDELRDRMNNIPKGILEPLELKKETEYTELILSYNTVVEELSYIMQQQSSYEKKRRDFLTSVSHELKTPIATINAYVEGLMSPVGDNPETRDRYHQIISDKMQHLMRQIEELFKYAQEESGRFKYHFEELYADEVFGQMFETFSNNHKLKTVIINHIPKCIVLIDKIRIEQVLMNLVNNAKKHSDSSGVITLRGYRQDKEIIIEVEDEGEGIVPKDMPYIFDSYYQGEQSEKKDYEGIGLGLSICKSILTQHKGRIKVKSVVGEGTTFIISIPIV